MVNDLKENEKKTKSKYGVFNGNTISQDTFGVEKSLVIKKIDSTEEDFTIEKIKEHNPADSNTMIVDEHTILNDRKTKSLNKTTKLVIIIFGVLTLVALLLFIILKYAV